MQSSSMSCTGPSRKFLVRIFIGVVLASLSIVLSGCGVQSEASDGPVDVSGINGSMHGGQQPVQQAKVAIYAAGNTGYGSANGTGAPLATTTTDNNGDFSLPAYTCPSASTETYVLSTGGYSGGSSQNQNPNSALAMVVATGPCGSTSSLTLNIDEVATVATMWALAPFISVNYGTAEVAGTSNALTIGTSAANNTGLVNAFNTVNNLVNLATGYSPGSPAGVTETVDTQMIYTLANILAFCVNSENTSGGATSSNCATLFSDSAFTLGGTTYTPADTVQAALAIAAHPSYTTITAGNNVNNPTYVTNLFNLASPQAAFGGAYTTPPVDFNIAVNYAAPFSGTGTGESIAVDGSGNVFVLNTNSYSVLSPVGAPYSSTAYTSCTTGTGCPLTMDANNSGSSFGIDQVIAVDTSGNAWMSSTVGTGTWVSTIFEGTTGGITAAYQGILSDGLGAALAIDGSGDVWFAEDGSSKYMSELTVPTGGGAYTYVGDKYPLGTTTTAMAIDNYSTGRIWNDNTASSSTGNIEGYLIGSASDFNGGFTNGSGATDVDVPWGIAVDSSNNIWVACEHSNSAQTGAHDTGTLEKIVPSSTSPGTAAPTFTNINTAGALNDPRSVAIDGAGNIWMANYNSVTDSSITYYSVSEYSPANAMYLSPLDSAGGVPIGYARTGIMNQPSGIAVDGSGNVWIANNGSNYVTEFVGAATPVITPIAKGLTSGFTPAMKP